MASKRGPIGVILAGGQSRRLGGAKAKIELGGRPLIAWPLGTMRSVLDEVVVVCKPGSPLPELDVEVWEEPAEPVHPRAGLVHALERADGRAVLACAVDLPLVLPPLIRLIADADAQGSPAVVPRAGGRLQPLLARYEPAALDALRSAPPEEPLTASVEALGPRVVEISNESAFLNVNTPEDLARAAQGIARK